MTNFLSFGFIAGTVAIVSFVIASLIISGEAFLYNAILTGLIAGILFALLKKKEIF